MDISCDSGEVDYIFKLAFIGIYEMIMSIDTIHNYANYIIIICRSEF